MTVIWLKVSPLSNGLTGLGASSYNLFHQKQGLLLSPDVRNNIILENRGMKFSAQVLEHWNLISVCCHIGEQLTPE